MKVKNLLSALGFCALLLVPAVAYAQHARGIHGPEAPVHGSAHFGGGAVQGRSPMFHAPSRAVGAGGAALGRRGADRAGWNNNSGNRGFGNSGAWHGGRGVIGARNGRGWGGGSWAARGRFDGRDHLHARHGGGWRSRFPLGFFVAALPFAIAPIWIAGSPYYYDNVDGVYFAPAPTGGYTVVPAPTGSIPDQAPATGSGDEPIFYPRNGQSVAQTEADRQECNRWAATQQQAVADATLFARAVAACMNGRGYSVG
jgi:hypothetical protein